MKCYDVCIVGGGVVGLWVARHLSASGLKIALVEREQCGSGASGGVLGALMAHAPENWNLKKQFQFEALAELPEVIDCLEKETGLQTGYGRCSRLMPIRRQNFLERALQRSRQADVNWRYGDHAFAFEVIKAPNRSETSVDWLAPENAPLGYVRDALAARIHPELYIAALKAGIKAAPNIDLIEHWAFGSFDETHHIIHNSDGSDRFTAQQIILAAGYETFTLLEPVLGQMIGGGVKGQAAVFRCPEGVGKPLIYDDSTYIVPHHNGLCAVGSTTEKSWRDAHVPDEARDDFIERARALCVPLRKAEMLGRWAGVRPRCRLTDPMIGRLPGRAIWVATGGYKITFGIAHRMAQYIANDVCGYRQDIDLPPTFRPDHHLQN